jgi:rare lipoprotein A
MSDIVKRIIYAFAAGWRYGMRALTRGWTVILVSMVALLFMVSCATDTAYVKDRDFRNAKAGDKRDDSDYEEENNDFGDAEKDHNFSDKKNRGEVENDGQEEGDTSYKKEKFYQTGMASWYGREFNGKKTASGERFNMNELTAAHKTLPFGTLVKVKNFDNGKTVTVRINDRGPYRGKRIIDLSYGAAKKIGMLKGGQTQVGLAVLKKGGTDEYDRDNDTGHDGELEAVSDDVRDESSTEDGSYAVQAGAFYSKRNADNLKSKIEGMTDKSVVVVKDGDMYKVRIEGMGSKKEVNRLKNNLANEDIPSYMIHKTE